MSGEGPTAAELDWYKRQMEGWRRGSARGAKVGAFPLAVPPVGFDAIWVSVVANGEDYGRIETVVYVIRDN